MHQTLSVCSILPSGLVGAGLKTVVLVQLLYRTEAEVILAVRLPAVMRDLLRGGLRVKDGKSKRQNRVLCLLGAKLGAGGQIRVNF